jgi:hypothetical protein
METGGLSKVVVAIALGFLFAAVVVAVILALCPLTRLNPAPYRKVRTRRHAPDGVGEIIILECGHELRLERQEFPCEACSLSDIETSPTKN